MRSGHTEAAVDLCKLAGLPPVGVIGELMNDDGTVMRGPQVKAFAEARSILLITVADLIAYRQMRERLVERVGELVIQTPIGPARGIAYRTPFDAVEQLALVYGDISSGEPIPVRLHRQDILTDTFGEQRTLKAVYARFQQEGRGVLVYLRDGAAGVPATPLTGGSADTDDHNAAAQRRSEWREIGLGAQILRDLGVGSITLLTNRAVRYVGLDGFGIKIAATEPLSR
jgi:3,4-dihydroxy 2-butanone 4-phosphate synthase/GTP cyclohydrolase II